MSAQPIEVVTVLPRPSVWDRIWARLRNWGRNTKAATVRATNWAVDTAKSAWSWLKGVTKRAWNWAKGGADAVVHSRAVSWAVTKTKVAASWAWSFLKTPVGVVSAAAGALATVSSPLFYTILGTVVLAGAGYLLIRGLTAPRIQPVAAVVTPVSEPVEMIPDTEIPTNGDEPGSSAVWSALNTPAAGGEETDHDRLLYLEEVLDRAHLDDQNVDLASELVGRIELVGVRSGADQELSHLAKATVSKIYHSLRRKLETDPEYRKTDWNWSRMYNAVRAEETRRKENTRLRAEIADKFATAGI